MVGQGAAFSVAFSGSNWVIGITSRSGALAFRASQEQLAVADHDQAGAVGFSTSWANACTWPGVTASTLSV